MSVRAVPQSLKRELRISQSRVTQNLAELAVTDVAASKLRDAISQPSGLLSLSGSELTLVERALGLNSGKPAVSLVGELVLVKRVPVDTGVSYGHIRKTSKDENLGLVALGFSDGLPRTLSDRFSATIDGVSYRSIGKMAMDQTVFELGDSSPSLGSEVHFFHDQFTIKDFAESAGITPLELFGRINARVQRIWTS